MRSLLVAVLLLLALHAGAQELSVAAGDSIQNVLAARKGKQVTVRLAGGQELTGTVRDATAKLLVLGALSGREFFDAAIPLERIDAVLVRAK
jgi:hypothetical protein